MTWIQTRDNQKFDLIVPDSTMIDPDTIAVVLGRICRFGGHCGPFYSVAQHSVLVAELVEEELKLPALLHDCHECYWGFGDILRPAKNLCPELRNILSLHTRKIDAAIAERFGFDVELFYHRDIKHADNVLLATEQRDLMGPAPFPWDELPAPLVEPIQPIECPTAAKNLFLERLNEALRDVSHTP